MKNIIDLLKQKNSLLENFLTLNENQLADLHEGIFDHLDQFYHSRDSLLDMIKILDSEVDYFASSPDTPEFSQEMKTTAHKELVKKDDLVKVIVAQDLQIISLIESKKSEIIKELQTVKEKKRVYTGYKTSTGPRRLNEKY